MTRHRTFLPRSTQSQCAVCDARVGVGHGRARCDLRGTVLCSKHGQQSRRYTESRMLDLQPDLSVLIRARPDLSWIRTMLDDELASKLVRPHEFGPTATRLPRLLPYPRAARPRHRRRGKATPYSTCCVLGEGRSEMRPWRGHYLCRACHARVVRQHARANNQFDALVKYVRRNKGCWLVPLLHRKLRARVVQQLARSRPPRVALDRDRYV